MANGTASLTQFSQIVNFFTTAIASIVNEFSIVDLINCLSKKGGKLTQFLRLVIKALLEGREIIIEYVKKNINIDRTQPFDAAKFIGDGWTIDEQDERSLKISEIDLYDLQLNNYLKEHETTIIKGEERKRRIKEDGRICLDAAWFIFFWNNKHLIPENWKDRVNGDTRYIAFSGTSLCNPTGGHFTLCLYWLKGSWYWRCLSQALVADEFSVILANKNI